MSDLMKKLDDIDNVKYIHKLTKALRKSIKALKFYASSENYDSLGTAFYIEKDEDGDLISFLDAGEQAERALKEINEIMGVKYYPLDTNSEFLEKWKDAK